MATLPPESILVARRMRALSIAAIAATGCLFLTAATFAGAPGGTGYEKEVPPHLRSLVTGERYEDVRQSLEALRRRYPDMGVIDDRMIPVVAASPCGESLSYLIDQFHTNPAVPRALDAVAAGTQDLPPDYAKGNPWKVAGSGHQLLRLMLPYFAEWCVFLPRIKGSHDDGLRYIQDFSWLYYHNEAGQAFVQGRDPLDPGNPLLTGLKFTRDFSNQRGAFLDSPASTAFIGEWIDNPRTEIRDYRKTRTAQYKSWNDFFAREIVTDPESGTIPSRPATMPQEKYPGRDYIVVSPTDCIMNPLVQVFAENGEPTRRLLENPMQLNTVLDVKNIPITLGELLKGVDDRYRSRFVGGTGLSCVLMPNTYHHFHAPVSGTIVHAAVMPGGTYGDIDFPNWAPTSGNVGRPGTDFSQFQVFQRGIIVIEVRYADAEGRKSTGYVASIPVGLNTVGSVVLEKDILPGKKVKRGYTRFGHFRYGGSLNLLLFSKGLAGGAVQTRLGTQINLLSAGGSPE